MLLSPELSQSWLQLAAFSSTLLVLAYLSYCLACIFYNLFLSPLRSYPGPLLWRMTRLPWEYHIVNGTLPSRMLEIHKQYGDSVRVAPDELSFTKAQAFKDIYSHIPGKEEFPKDPMAIAMPPNGIPNIVGASKETHSRYRRLLAHGFSEKGLRDQESHIRKYVDLLVDRLGEKADANEVTDLVNWYNMTVFDVIGDLAFGESFNSLQDRKLHEWIPAISGNVKFVQVSGIMRRRGLDFLNPYFVSKETQALRAKNYKLTTEKLEKRVQLGTDRGDFWDRIMIKSADDNKSGDGMTKGEMVNNASTLVLGGSETSATVLSGATYLLLRNPGIMKKLTDEIRSAFKSSEEITLFSTQHLPYMLGVLEETMRLYTPAAGIAPRVVPKGGSVVCGTYLPEGGHFYSAGKVASNWHRPSEFIPERWLEDAPTEFADDNKAAFQPFSLGTRNCIGRNLAYAEMRLILAKVLFNFDLELDSKKTGDWFDQKAWLIWWKNPLWVKMQRTAQ